MFKFHFTVMPWFKQKNKECFDPKLSCNTTTSGGTAPSCPSRNTSFFITCTTSLVLDHLDSFSAVVVIAVGRCHRCESCDAP